MIVMYNTQNQMMSWVIWNLEFAQQKNLVLIQYLFNIDNLKGKEFYFLSVSS